MSVAQPSIQERRPAPGASLALSSNNPFRRKPAPPPPPTAAPSTANATAQSPPNELPNPNNPFLDGYGSRQPPPPTGREQQPTSPQRKVMGPPSGRPIRQPTANGSDPADLLNGLVLSEKPDSERNIMPRPPHSRNEPVPRQGGHRVARSDEEQPHKPHLPNFLLKPRGNGSQSPRKRENQHVRRNSESSVMDVKLEEQKTQDGNPDGGAKDGRPRQKRPHRPRKPYHPLDLIDKLDATGIYGPGLFHHDGPFDACNPHRNRKGLKAAPMQAFAEGSLNNTLGGSGPLRKDTDIDKLHGRVAEGYSDYNVTSSQRPVQRPPQRDPQRDYQLPVADIINPYARTQIHGDESFGLGTSTFLEGTPVSRAALQRQLSETDTNTPTTGQQLQRKKSLAQKFRGGFSRPRGDSNDGRIYTPDAKYADPSSPNDLRQVQSAGGRGRLVQEVNPFFVGTTQDQQEKMVPVAKVESAAVSDNAADKESSDVEDEGVVGQARTTESPPRPQTAGRSNEQDADGKTGVGGLLTRVKSLRGGKRTRPERTSG